MLHRGNFRNQGRSSLVTNPLLKVEIRGNADGLSVEWCCARIISGDGHTYSVQYDCSSTTSEASIERVSRKAIRPCPPLIKGIESWAANDHVEVYIAGS